MTNRARPVQHTLDTPYPVGPVHCYTLEQDGGIILFDTGPPTANAENYFRRNIRLPDIRHIIVTHCHIDHYGLAHWLQQETGATVYLPYRDYLKIARNEERLEGMFAYLKSIGFDDSFVSDLYVSMSSGSVFPELPAKYLVAEDHVGTLLGMDVLGCPGHSQSDLVYATKEWAVTGDTLLEGIFQSPLLDIDLETGRRFQNYAAYCTSLVNLMQLDGRTILPGHRHKVESVRATLHSYLVRLLQKVMQYLPFRGEKNIRSVIAGLSLESLSPFQVYFKVSEILFVFDLFEEPDRLREALTRTGLFDELRTQYLQALGRTT